MNESLPFEKAYNFNHIIQYSIHDQVGKHIGNGTYFQRTGKVEVYDLNDALIGTGEKIGEGPGASIRIFDRDNKLIQVCGDASRSPLHFVSWDDESDNSLAIWHEK
ncbi:hypothetical protein [Rudanella lutea]|uniref:hypothetical protein n=1 Tax=Rudanella lutea TaxID=451374 RepID=UPI000370779D|nr:hypothetical protein [Rudanella lutea]